MPKREFAITNQSRLLDNNGMAHMEQEMVRTVLKIGTQQTGVESSLIEEDTKECLAEVMEEVKKLKK